jgi:hypothetical protein
MMSKGTGGKISGGLLIGTGVASLAAGIALVVVGIDQNRDNSLFCDQNGFNSSCPGASELIAGTVLVPAGGLLVLTGASVYVVGSREYERGKSMLVTTQRMQLRPTLQMVRDQQTHAPTGAVAGLGFHY